ncbi:hypothetical protein ACFSCW_08660 [Sphingomonas tabacisoli]|uniref:Uncharacterized protein n=1 Tax=Sphingomonas tabacisoli TaxID=2249466 RepID=A0ABW4I3Z5_9SPHN
MVDVRADQWTRAKADTMSPRLSHISRLNGFRLRLLLHILALIAGFTGLVAGPASARVSEPAVIAAALSGNIEQATESRTARRAMPAAENPFDIKAQGEAAQPVFTPQPHPVDERRIE